MIHKVSIAEAAERLGATPQYIRMGLRTGRLPFGTAVLMEGGRWSYNIPRPRFERYIAGLDLSDQREVSGK